MSICKTVNFVNSNSLIDYIVRSERYLDLCFSELKRSDDIQSLEKHKNTIIKIENEHDFGSIISTLSYWKCTRIPFSVIEFFMNKEIIIYTTIIENNRIFKALRENPWKAACLSNDVFNYFISINYPITADDIINTIELNNFKVFYHYIKDKTINHNEIINRIIFHDNVEFLRVCDKKQLMFIEDLINRSIKNDSYKCLEYLLEIQNIDSNILIDNSKLYIVAIHFDSINCFQLLERLNMIEDYTQIILYNCKKILTYILDNMYVSKSLKTNILIESIKNNYLLSLKIAMSMTIEDLKETIELNDLIIIANNFNNNLFLDYIRHYYQ